MLRLTELRLPLEHSAEALRAAIVARLGIADADLLATSIARRGYDARKRNAIVFVYSVDCEVRGDEALLLARHAGDPHMRVAPDTRYRPPVVAPADLAGRSGANRPVVVGFGPCGIFCAPLLAQEIKGFHGLFGETDDALGREHDSGGGCFLVSSSFRKHSHDGWVTMAAATSPCDCERSLLTGEGSVRRAVEGAKRTELRAVVPRSRWHASAALPTAARRSMLGPSATAG